MPQIDFASGLCVHSPPSPTLARAIASQVQVQLTPQERTLLSENRSVDPEAHDYFLRGRIRLAHEGREDNQAAIAMLERAVAIDPAFPDAYADLSHAYIMKLFYFAPQNPTWGEKAKSAADRALALDPNSSEAHMARGLWLWTHVSGLPRLSVFPPSRPPPPASA